ncbi:MAG: HAD hydrolase-like protein [Clostridia bacterium]|nr:HAD hydrolase-like protein [Clostridia bacterium]
MEFNNKKYIFFDFDGTIVDTGPGIKNGVRYALEKLGVPVREGDTLDGFIGPPMTQSYPNNYDLDAETTKEAIRIFREYYADKGQFECSIYPGIELLLSDLKKAGKVLCVATSKPEKFAEKILDRFFLLRFLDVFVGATLDGTREKKADVLNCVFERLGQPDRTECVLIGDRHYDVDGAKACSMESVGVLYGYGNREEFELAGADEIVETVADLRRLLLPDLS